MGQDTLAGLVREVRIERVSIGNRQKGGFEVKFERLAIRFRILSRIDHKSRPVSGLKHPDFLYLRIELD